MFAAGEGVEGHSSQISSLVNSVCFFFGGGGMFNYFEHMIS